MSAEYAEYPLTMTHPDFHPAVSKGVPGTEVRGANGEVVSYRSYQGSPERLPPQVAMDAQQEEYWASNGYHRAGKIDPSAWVKAHSAAPPEDYKPQKYPMWRDGVLILTAQEDPQAAPEDLEPQSAPAPQAAPEAPPPSQADNARAAAAELERVKSATLEDENAKLRAEIETLKAKATEPAAPRRRKRATGDDGGL
jgi:hypothetical protein